MRPFPNNTKTHNIHFTTMTFTRNPSSSSLLPSSCITSFIPYAPSSLRNIHPRNHTLLHNNTATKPSSHSSNRPIPLTMRVMRFRPCIDLHDGRVKQIVGATLTEDAGDKNNKLAVNFETTTDASYYASMYASDNLPGGHVIMLGRTPENERQAISALRSFPGGMHIGGGMTPQTSMTFLDAGASHVIVTSYVFHDGDISWERVEEMHAVVNKNRLVLDVSCRKRKSDGKYIVCTNRWQKWTQFEINSMNIGRLGDQCDELLIHAVDVEGTKSGIDLDLIHNLSQWASCPITYAGGVSTLQDLEYAKDAGRGYIDITIGSALDIFGGHLKYEDAVKWQRQQEQNNIINV